MCHSDKSCSWRVRKFPGERCMGQVELCLHASPTCEGKSDRGSQSSNIPEQLNSLSGLPGSAGRFSVLTWAPFILVTQCCLQQPHGSSCIRRQTTHTQPRVPHMASPGHVWREDSSVWSSGFPRRGWLPQNWILSLLMQVASLAAQHPVCMRHSQIVICHHSSLWLPIRLFT